MNVMTPAQFESIYPQIIEHSAPHVNVEIVEKLADKIAAVCKETGASNADVLFALYTLSFDTVQYGVLSLLEIGAEKAAGN